MIPNNQAASTLQDSASVLSKRQKIRQLFTGCGFIAIGGLGCACLALDTTASESGILAYLPYVGILVVVYAIAFGISYFGGISSRQTLSLATSAAMLLAVAYGRDDYFVRVKLDRVNPNLAHFDSHWRWSEHPFERQSFSYDHVADAVNTVKQRKPIEGWQTKMSGGLSREGRPHGVFLKRERDGDAIVETLIYYWLGKQVSAEEYARNAPAQAPG